MDADQSVQSLKNLILASLVIITVWFLTFPAARDKLTEYRLARDLHAWLYVRDAVSGLKDLAFEHEPPESIESVYVDVVDPTSRGDGFEEELPLTVRSVWPELRNYLYSEADESLENCAGNGVLAPVPGVIGTLMAVETLKHLVGLDVERGRLLLFDAGSGVFRSVTIPKRGDCQACH